MTLPIIYISPSRVETEWRCERARYWGHEFEGVGLEPITSAVELIYGGIVHQALASIAQRRGTEQGGVIDDLLIIVAQQCLEMLTPICGTLRGREYAALGQGQVRGFFKHVWPRLMREYEIVCVEREFFYLIDETVDYVLKLRCKPDLILRNRITSKLWYIEYKTTSNDSAKWINSWNRAVQVHVGCVAAGATLGEPVDGSVVIGLYKGFEKYDRLNSVFTYGFRNMGRPGVTRDQYSYTYKPKWERFFIPDVMELGDWVDGMDRELLGAQFPETPPMFVRDDLIADWVDQRRARERRVFVGNQKLLRIAAEPDALAVDTFAKRMVLNDTFSQNFSACTPAWGFECKFNPACWLSHVGKDPVGSGYYIKREPREVHE